MAHRTNARGPSGNIEPRDPQYRQGLVTVSRDFATNAATTLRTSSPVDRPVYPIGSESHYTVFAKELVWAFRTPANSVSTSLVKQKRHKIARLGSAVATAPQVNDQAGISALNGFRLNAGIDPSTLSDDEYRNAILNNLHLLGVAAHDFGVNDAGSGRQMTTQLAGALPMFADVPMPELALVEYTVPTRAEALADKFGRKKFGVSPAGKVCLITRPATANSLATEFYTQLKWYIRDPAQFRAAMDPRITDTQTWQAACQETIAHTAHAIVVAQPWLAKWGATAEWPLVRDANGVVRELTDNDVYSRAQNQGSHMFYAAVGFADGKRSQELPSSSNAQDGATVAGRMRELRRRKREDPAAYAEALALALGHVQPIDVTTTVGLPNAPVARVDATTIAWFAGGGGAAGAAETLSLQQCIMRSVFWNATDRSFMFGTSASGENRHVDSISGKPLLRTTGGRIIERQGTSFERSVAAISNAHTISQSRIIGRVIRPAQQGQLYTLLKDKTVL